jgi:hypothetical protein
MGDTFWIAEHWTTGTQLWEMSLVSVTQPEPLSQSGNLPPWLLYDVSVSFFYSFFFLRLLLLTTIAGNFIKSKKCIQKVKVMRIIEWKECLCERKILSYFRWRPLIAVGNKALLTIGDCRFVFMFWPQLPFPFSLFNIFKYTYHAVTLLCSSVNSIGLF